MVQFSYDLTEFRGVLWFTKLLVDNNSEAITRTRRNICRISVKSDFNYIALGTDVTRQNKEMLIAV